MHFCQIVPIRLDIMGFCDYLSICSVPYFGIRTGGRMIYRMGPDGHPAGDCLCTTGRVCIRRYGNSRTGPGGLQGGGFAFRILGTWLRFGNRDGTSGNLGMLYLRGQGVKENTIAGLALLLVSATMDPASPWLGWHRSKLPLLCDLRITGAEISSDI